MHAGVCRVCRGAGGPGGGGRSRQALRACAWPGYRLDSTHQAHSCNLAPTRMKIPNLCGGYDMHPASIPNWTPARNAAIPNLARLSPTCTVPCPRHIKHVHAGRHKFPTCSHSPAASSGQAGQAGQVGQVTGAGPSGRVGPQGASIAVRTAGAVVSRWHCKHCMGAVGVSGSGLLRRGRVGGGCPIGWWLLRGNGQ
jgi:hypothetical protein